MTATLPEHIKTLIDESSDGIAVITYDGKVVANNFNVLRWLPQLDIRALYNEASRFASEHPGEFIPLSPSPFPKTKLTVNWLGDAKQSLVICIGDELIGKRAADPEVPKSSSVSFETATPTNSFEQPFARNASTQAESTIQGLDPNAYNQIKDMLGFDPFEGTVHSEPVNQPQHSFNQSQETPIGPSQPFRAESMPSQMPIHGAQQTEKSLWDSVARLAQIGTFRANLVDSSTFWSSEFYSILGITTSEKPGFALLERYIFSEHRKKVMGAIYSAINDGEFIEVDFLATRGGDASLLPVKLKAQVSRNEYGVATSVDGYIQVQPDIRQSLPIQQELHGVGTNHSDIEQYIRVVGSDLAHPVRLIQQTLEDFGQDLGPLFSPHNREQFEYLKNKTNKLSILLDGLLTYAEAYQPTSEPVWIDTQALIEYAIKSAEVPENVRIDTPTLWPTFFQAEHKLLLILQHLLVNAYRFNKAERPVIRLALQPAANGLLFTITDNGPGIPDYEHENVFNLFYTLNNRPMTAGVGLTVVRKLVSQLGGTVEIANNVAIGTTINFLLPGQVGPPIPKVVQSALPTDLVSGWKFN